MMYTSNFWLGALVLVRTSFTTFLIIGVAIANAEVARLADAINFLGWLLLAHVLWLITRMFWVWNMYAPRPSLPTAYKRFQNASEMSERALLRDCLVP